MAQQSLILAPLLLIPEFPTGKAISDQPARAPRQYAPALS